MVTVNSAGQSLRSVWTYLSLRLSMKNTTVVPETVGSRGNHMAGSSVQRNKGPMSSRLVDYLSSRSISRVLKRPHSWAVSIDHLAHSRANPNKCSKEAAASLSSGIMCLRDNFSAQRHNQATQNPEGHGRHEPETKGSCRPRSLVFCRTRRQSARGP